MSEPADILARVCSAIADGERLAAAERITSQYPFEPLPVVKRRYTADQALRVFIRDGFIDRYTGRRLIFAPVLHVIHDLFPDEFPHHPAWKTTSTHPAFNELSATLDHVVPVASGGIDDDSNWVTTSMTINFAKNNARLSSLQWKIQPAGSFEEWDGLLRWFVDYTGEFSSLHPRSAIRRWVGPARRALRYGAL